MKTTQLSGRARIVLALALITSLGGAASAQTNATNSADIQRLQDNVFETARDVTALRSRDAVLASQLQENGRNNPEVWANVLRGWLAEEEAN